MNSYWVTRRYAFISLLLGFTLPALAQAIDTDADGLTDADEVAVYGTDPQNKDTDWDTLQDGQEVLQYGTNPLNRDTEDDGLNDFYEIRTIGTNPLVKDTDGDLVNDWVENNSGFNPLDPADADPDADGYPSIIEAFYGTSPVDAAAYPLPPSYVDQVVESFEAPFDNRVWTNVGAWRTTSDSAGQGLRSLKVGGPNTQYIKLTVNVRAATRLYFLYKVDSSSVLGSVYVNGVRRADLRYGAGVWLPGRESAYSVNYGLPVDAGVNVIQFSSSDLGGISIDDIRFAVADADVDGMGDAWEQENGFNPNSPADMPLDVDSDGFTTLDEALRGTDPRNGDTDGDGVLDGAEPAAGLNPLRADVGADSDGDSLLDTVEVLTHKTEPYVADTDYDGWSDAFEITRGLNPLSNTDAAADADTDGDRHPNIIEVMYGTSPSNAASKPPIAVYADGQKESFEPPFDAVPWNLGSGSAAWTVTNGVAVDGNYSLRSGTDTTTSAVLTINTRAATIMNFRFRSDDPVSRRLSVRINGGSSDYAITSGSGPWKYASVNLAGFPAGVKRFEFVSYRQGGQPAVGCDCIYIDDIQFYHYPDYDQDGMSNAWETENGLNDNDAADAGLDLDNDGLTAIAEYRAGTAPGAWDSDGDTLADGFDASWGLNPLQNDREVDSDNDGVSNATEARNATDPNSAASKPEPLGTYFESFEAGLPPFWFSSGSTDLAWQWTPLLATDGQASIVGETGPLQINRSPNASLLVITDDSFLSFDYAALNYAAYPGCGASDCTVNAQFSLIVDDEPVYALNPAGLVYWTPVGGVFLPAGEHLIEFGLTSPACVGAACSNAQADDVAQTWLDSLLIKPADPQDETDSDGDSVSDYDEVYQHNTDPMFPDIVCEDPANPPDGLLFNEDCDTGCHP